MNELRKDVRENDDILDSVLELQEVVDVYSLGEFLEKEPIRIKGSAILKSKQRTESAVG